MKTCCNCKKEKDYSLFYKDSHSKDGYAYRCKDCRKEYEKEYAKTDKYKIKVRRNRWKEANINITHEEYEQLLKQQDGRCAVCSTDTNQFGKGMCVDHCHSTGKIRGLLCTECNLGLGYFKDKIELLENAKKYLDRVVI